MPKDIDAQEVASLVAAVDKLIEEKKKYFPGNKRVILNYDISENEDGLKLDINSAPIKDE
jgi:hypothetical protein